MTVYVVLDLGGDDGDVPIGAFSTLEEARRVGDGVSDIYAITVDVEGESHFVPDPPYRYWWDSKVGHS